jgi:hypothetical protein
MAFGKHVVNGLKIVFRFDHRYLSIARFWAARIFFTVSNCWRSIKISA